MMMRLASIHFIIVFSWMLIPDIQASDEKFIFTIQTGSLGDVRDVHISVDPRLSMHNLGGMHEIGIFHDRGVALLTFDLPISPETVIKAARLELFCNSVGFSEEEIRRDVT